MRKFALTLLSVVSGLFAALPATANPYRDMVNVSVLPGWRGADGVHVAGLRIDLADGWKTYWRAPGDAGVPPLFDWSGSRNLRDVQITWPKPVVFDQSGLRTLGYKRSVVLPLAIMAKDRQGTIHLNGRIDFGICHEICVPVSVVFATDLKPEQTKRDPAIVAAAAARPWSADEAGVGKVTCQIQPVKDGLALTARIELPKTGRSEMAVIESRNPSLWVSETQSARSGRFLDTKSTIYHNDGRPFALNRSELRFTVIGSDQAVDIQGCEAG